jgi:hypothetical protein
MVVVNFDGLPCTAIIASISASRCSMYAKFALIPSRSNTMAKVTNVPPFGKSTATVFPAKIGERADRLRRHYVHLFVIEFGYVRKLLLDVFCVAFPLEVIQGIGAHWNGPERLRSALESVMQIPDLQIELSEQERIEWRCEMNAGNNTVRFKRRVTDANAHPDAWQSFPPFRADTLLQAMDQFPILAQWLQEVVQIDEPWLRSGKDPTALDIPRKNKHTARGSRVAEM